MRNIVLNGLFLLALMSPARAAPAQDAAPDLQLKEGTAEVLEILRQQPGKQIGSVAKGSRLAESKILQLFDFDRMTEDAMAQNWELASTEQRAALATEFRALLIRAYFTALSGYRDHPFEFKAIQIPQEAREATITCEVRMPGRERFAIVYDTEKTAAGWRVYNVKVGGVSLVRTYRNFFAEKVRNSGLAGLIKSLVEKNQSADAQVKR